MFMCCRNGACYYYTFKRVVAKFVHCCYCGYCSCSRSSLVARKFFHHTRPTTTKKSFTHKIEICFQLVKVLFIRIYWANKLWIIYWNNFMRMRNLWTQSKEFGFNVPLCNTYILIFFALTFLWMLIKLFLYCRRAARECCADENEPSQKYDNKQITHINFSMFTVSFSLSLFPSVSQRPYNSIGCWFLALSLLVSLDDGCVST